jgi:hypothetical protein
MTDNGKTHYRKAFDSPYLSSADIVEPTMLTVAYVRLEPDHTKKTKDLFNTAHFVEKELRPGEKLKPMILNATNSKTLRNLTGSAFIDDWNNVRVTVYVEPNVKFGRESVEGLRISSKAPAPPVDVDAWIGKVNACDTSDSLQDTWKLGGNLLRESGNRDGYARLKDAVTARLEAIKAKAAEAAVEAEA